MSFLLRAVALAAALGLVGCGTPPSDRSATVAETPRAVEERPAAPEHRSDDALARAYDHHQSNVQVEGEGTVSRVLRDDTDGARHQRFILRLDSRQTLLVAHNIDLARRVEGLKPGDRVSFRGEYEWNAAGGVLHWTHDDPAGRHPGGWIKHGGKTYH